MEGLEVPFKAIEEGLNSIGEFFKNLISYLNPLDENFIFTKLFSNINKIVSWVNPFSEDFFLSKLFSWINPFSENFFGKKLIELFFDLLESLFIPNNNPFSELSNKFNTKFSFINQIKDLLCSLLGFNNYGENCPTFEMTWRGVTFAFIDFSMFLQYRLWLHGIILAISWFIFIKRTYYKLPGIIGGFSQ